MQVAISNAETCDSMIIEKTTKKVIELFECRCTL